MRFLLALCALFFAAPAHAVTYHYTGQEIVCPPDVQWDCFGGPGFTGSITIAEPVSRLSIKTTQTDRDLMIYETSYDFDGVTSTSAGRIPSYPGLELTGIFYDLFYQTVCCEAEVILTFDEHGNVETWSAGAFWGGSNDPMLNTQYDAFFDGSRSIGPGTWITVVPLPASGLLLGFALMTVSAARWRRWRLGSDPRTPRDICPT